MAVKWFKTQHPGVRYYEHNSRKVGRGQTDKYFTIRYTIDGKTSEEGLGWASEGWSPIKAYTILSDIKEAARTGEGAQSLAEKRALAAEAREKKQEAARLSELTNISMRMFFEQYFMPHSKKTRRAWLTDEQRIAKEITPVFGDFPIRALSKNVVQAIVDEWSKKMSPATVEQYFGIIRRTFNVAAETLVHGTPLFTGLNPCKGVKLPQVTNARDRFFTADEVENILKETKKCRYPDLHDCCVISLNTGLRLGELKRLLWSDVDLVHNILTVREEAQRKPGGKVPINTDAANIFKMRLQERKDDSPLVFPPRTAGTERRSNLSHLFGDIADKLGLNAGITDTNSKAVFHTFRHTFASWLAIQGTDIYIIKELMRHKRIEMTMRYAHLSPGVTHKAVESLCCKSKAKID